METAYTDDAAVEAYAICLESIRAQLAKLTRMADDMMGVNPDKLDWGHVGDASRIHAKLGAIIDGD